MNLSTSVTLKWNTATKPNILVGGAVVIRHQAAQPSQASWANATELATVAGSATSAQVPLITGTYLVKFRSSSGILSENVKAIYVEAPAENLYEAFVFNEHLTSPPFNGTKVNVRYDTEDSGLLLEGGVFLDAIGIGEDWDSYGTIDGLKGLIDAWTDNLDSFGDIDFLPLIDSIGENGGWDAVENVDLGYGEAVNGEYYFDTGGSPVDLNGIFTVNVVRKLLTEGYLLVSDIDGRVDFLDYWTDFDAVTAEAANANVQMRSSSDGSNFTDWTNVVNSLVTARYFDFRLVMSSPQSGETILTKQLGATINIPERTETKTITGNGAIVFDRAFYATPSVVISGFNAQSGDYYQVTSTSRTGMTVTWYNSSNSPVSRTFSYQAAGYGTEIV